MILNVYWTTGSSVTQFRRLQKIFLHLQQLELTMAYCSIETWEVISAWVNQFVETLESTFLRHCRHDLMTSVIALCIGQGGMSSAITSCILCMHSTTRVSCIFLFMRILAVGLLCLLACKSKLAESIISTSLHRNHTIKFLHSLLLTSSMPHIWGI
jgi:hypothetical protein